MNEYRPKPPRKSKSQQSQPGMIKYRKYKGNIDNFESNAIKKVKNENLKNYYEVEDLLKLNIDLKKKINSLISDRNKLITEARANEENRLRLEKKCHDLMKTTADSVSSKSLDTAIKAEESLSSNLKKIIQQNRKEISILENEINEIKDDIRYTRLNEMEIEIKTFYKEILRLNRILELFNVDGDGVINFLNERSQYKRTIEELNEKLSTYEKNSKIMKENFKEISRYKEDNEILIEKFYLMRDKLENLNKNYKIATNIIENQKKEIQLHKEGIEKKEQEIESKNKKIKEQQDEYQKLIKKNKDKDKEFDETKKELINSLTIAENEKNLKKEYEKFLKDEKLNFIELENKLTKKKQKIKILKEKIRDFELIYDYDNKGMIDLNDLLKEIANKNEINNIGEIENKDVIYIFIIKKLNERLNEYSIKIDDYERACQMEQLKLKNKEDCNNEYQDEINNCKELIEKLNNTINQKQRIIDTQELQIKDLKSIVETKNDLLKDNSIKNEKSSTNLTKDKSVDIKDECKELNNKQKEDDNSNNNKNDTPHITIIINENIKNSRYSLDSSINNNDTISSTSLMTESLTSSQNINDGHNKNNTISFSVSNISTNNNEENLSSKSISICKEDINEELNNQRNSNEQIKIKQNEIEKPLYNDFELSEIKQKRLDEFYINSSYSNNDDNKIDNNINKKNNDENNERADSIQEIMECGNDKLYGERIITEEPETVIIDNEKKDYNQNFDQFPPTLLDNNYDTNNKSNNSSKVKNNNLNSEDIIEDNKVQPFNNENNYYSSIKDFNENKGSGLMINNTGVLNSINDNFTDNIIDEIKNRNSSKTTINSESFENKENLPNVSGEVNNINNTKKISRQQIK
jgi:hypothetical protein